MARYEAIQAFKNSRSALIGSVNYAHVVAIYLYDDSQAGWIKKLVFSLFFRTRLVQKTSRGRGLLLFYSCRHKRRADYDFIMNRLREIAGPDGDYAESVERFDPRQWIHTFANLPAALRASRGYPADFLRRLGAALLIAKYVSSARKVLGPLLRGKSRLVTFCDAQPSENLIAQLASAMAVDTVTSQHGQYRLLEGNSMSPDAEAYANFVSDRMFCWGGATLAEFERFGFCSSRFVVTGWIRDWGGEVTLPPTGTSLGIFGVMLNGENGKESNAPLIETANAVAEILGLRYLVRMHPLNDLAEYKDIVSNRCLTLGCFAANDYACKVDFSIAHMSGAVIEMLRAGPPVYLFDDGRLAAVFRMQGLSYESAQAIAEAVCVDRNDPEHWQVRRAKLSLWYNDDREQAEKIRQILLAKET